MNIFKKNNKKTDNDIEYIVTFPPMGIDYDSWDKRTANNYFNWYIDQIPQRTKYLCERVSVDLNIDISLLDFSPMSLNIIWGWYLKIAIIKKTDAQELEKFKKTQLYQLVGESSINYEKLSLNSLIIQRDIGMYLAEVFLRECPLLTWTFTHDSPSKKVKDFFNNRPQLTGFIHDGSVVSFEPIHMVGVQASRLLNDTCETSDLYNLYELWSEKFPKDI